MATLPGPFATPTCRPARAWPVLALAAAVLVVHAWLAALLAPGAPRAGLPTGAPVLLRSLPAAAVLAAPAATTALAAAPAAPLAPAPRRTATPAHPAAPPAAAVADLPVPTAPAEPRAAVTDPLADATTTAAPDGEPPPLYATRVPPPATLFYALRHNGRAGSAVLAWAHDGTAYRLTLDAQGDDGRPLLAQASSGGFDANGLAPERFVDRRAGGRQRAANFRREPGPGGGRISYSGPGHAHPAWPGAQDRLSWLAQLAAILAAAEAPPDALRLFVADATGQAGLWQLQQLQQQADGGAAMHWRREPPRPEGLQIDLWLPAPAGGAADHAGWPLRLRFTVPRSGDQLELVRQPPP
ncbi:MAG TPA: hypothetical protein PK306_18705 [Aquabacterium sp.]|nr:hypothetical protein [Aquabacterium sp.]